VWSIHEAEVSELMDNPPPRELVELRLRAEQSMRPKDDRTLLDLSSELRSDEECWVHLWAPAVAIAARRLGSADALAILEEAVAGGFRQPELFDGETAGLPFSYVVRAGGAPR
jgi:hypothetical protein